jgi:pimeloyl-ACP methyl ester carboxylesterase
MGPRRTAVLVHGFLRTGRNMRPLAARLEVAGYRTVLAELDTVFGRFDRALDVLSATIAQAGSTGPLHLVGHSLGGLLIRHLLAREAIARIAPSVLIAAPADGSPLARTWRALLRPFPTNPIPLLDALQSGLPPIPPPVGNPPLGVIAGTGRDFPEGYCFAPWFHGEPHDGRVALAATCFDGMSDFTVLPLGHRAIHHRPETADLVLRFFETGRF